MYNASSKSGSPSELSVRICISGRYFLAASNMQVARASAAVLPLEVKMLHPCGCVHSEPFP